MRSFRPLSAPEQVADYLREAIYEGYWSETIPGAPRLSEESGVNHQTIEAALHLLELEGLLENNGPGRRRRIARQYVENPSLRVANLPYNPTSKTDPYVLDLFHRLVEAGYRPIHTQQALTELKMDPHRVKDSGGLSLLFLYPPIGARA
jgi:DNA-binding transcriptional MocR family regulator